MEPTTRPLVSRSFLRGDGFPWNCNLKQLDSAGLGRALASLFSSRRHRAFTFYDATFQWDFGRESRDEAGPRQATPP